MAEVLMKLTPHARGLMATKLFEAAEELGLDASVVRSQSEGFKVPEDLHRYLFPSEYEESESATPAEDFGDLSEDELDELTTP